MSQTNASAMPLEMKAAIEAFAKSRNVSPSACLQAAAIALAMQPFEEESAGEIITTEIPTVNAPAVKQATTRKPRAQQPQQTQPRVRREAGEKSVQFRDAVVAKAADLKGKRHTFAEIGAMFGIDQANASNNLKWLQKHKKVDYKVVGTASKAAGQKGRAPAIIEFV